MEKADRQKEDRQKEDRQKEDIQKEDKEKEDREKEDSEQKKKNSVHPEIENEQNQKVYAFLIYLILSSL